MISFSEPLILGKFIKRYKRFFADVELDGKVVVAHVPNTGSLKTCLFPGTQCYLSRSKDPERKLKYTLEATTNSAGQVIGVNTQWPNKLVHELWKQKKISHWKNFEFCKPEYKLNSETRFDFKMSSDENGVPYFVEVKNVTYLKDNGLGQFPDAVTERGQKHLRELIKLKQEGAGAEVVFVIQRRDVEKFSPCAEIDPDYARLYNEARTAGVRMTPLVFSLQPQGFEFQGEI